MRQVLSTAASTVVNVDQWMHGQRIAVCCTVSSVVYVCILRLDLPVHLTCRTLHVRQSVVSIARCLAGGCTHVDHIGAGAAAAGNMRMLHVVASLYCHAYMCGWLRHCAVGRSRYFTSSGRRRMWMRARARGLMAGSLRYISSDLFLDCGMPLDEYR